MTAEQLRSNRSIASEIRNSILQEAISGRLVSQDPNDEPAAALLQRIREEKARLVKEGTIKAKEVLEYTIDDIPYELPDNWSWVKLGEISYPIKRGKSPVYVENSQYIAFAQKCNTKKGYIDLGLAKYIESKKAETQADIYLKLGDIVINSTGTGTLGRVGLFNVEYPENIIGVVPDSHVATVRLLSIYPEYAYYFLRTCQAYLESLGEGGTNQKELKPSSIAGLLIPLPPLAEQKRIVAKLEELLPIVEQYGKAQKELNELNAALPARLRQSILQEAISGKLVPQNENDEPASVLLGHIQTEKQRLVKEKILKAKDIVVTPIPEDELPFDIPETWSWCRLGELAFERMGKTPPRGESEYWLNAKYPWVSISDMKDYGHVKTTKEGVSEIAAQKAFRQISPIGSLLMSFKLTVGRTAILDIDAYHNEAIITIQPYVDKEYAFRNYLFYVLPLLANLGDSKDAIKGKTLNSTSLYNLFIPLPPLAEQQRIVAKIEELFEQIDKIRE